MNNYLLQRRRPQHGSCRYLICTFRALRNPFRDMRVLVERQTSGESAIAQEHCIGQRAST